VERAAGAVQACRGQCPDRGRCEQEPLLKPAKPPRPPSVAKIRQCRPRPRLPRKPSREALPRRARQPRRRRRSHRSRKHPRPAQIRAPRPGPVLYNRGKTRSQPPASQPP
jgi:hypothetical protein